MEVLQKGDQSSGLLTMTCVRREHRVQNSVISEPQMHSKHGSNDNLVKISCVCLATSLNSLSSLIAAAVSLAIDIGLVVFRLSCVNGLIYSQNNDRIHM